jgi:hypothetical protein
MGEIWYSIDNMFIDHTRSLVTDEATVAQTPPPQKNYKKILIISIFVLLIGAAAWWWFTSSDQQNKTVEKKPEEIPSVVLPNNPVLPSNNSDTDPNGSNANKSETLAFGSLYKSFTEPFDQKIKTIDLPLNVKSEVSNYYVIARKINIDAAVTNLNKNGFAIIDNPFAKESDSFFGIYSQLNQRGLPMLVTSDFLLYYYQNSLKNIYKDIEASYFYDNVWKVNKQMFEAANSRFQERQRKLGTRTDSLLEAERLEASYFATSLVLLSPKATQINVNEDLNDTRKFKPSEAKRYEFVVPSYLAEDITREIALIQEAKKTEKSPVLLYTRSYSDFRVPDEYSNSAKLRNFYLASRWQSTLFPLNYKDETCTNCLLDKEDWTINQTAAYLISEDMSASQSIKNEWAKVYKVMSFFSGLRSGLTYLHYQAARQELFPGKTDEEIFATDAFKNLSTLQVKLQGIAFKLSEGGYNTQNSVERPLIGMRLLQTSYWPNQYIYNHLTNTSVGQHNRPKSSNGKISNYFTSCLDSKKGSIERCRGIGFDILATITTETPLSTFIKDNIDYNGYNEQRTKLQQEFSAYNQGEWYVNNFWTTLSILKQFINEKIPALAYTKTQAWKDRQISASLSALTALQLPTDEWQVNRLTPGKNLVTSSGDSKFHYVEAQNTLNDELVANTSMLFKALTELGVVQDTDAQFKDLLDKLKTVREITRQELKGEKLTANNYQFIVDLVSQYSVSKQGDRSTTVRFVNPATNEVKNLQQTIGPLKLLLIVYEENGQKVLVVGPVIHYKEQ